MLKRQIEVLLNNLVESDLTFQMHTQLAVSSDMPDNVISWFCFGSSC